MNVLVFWMDGKKKTGEPRAARLARGSLVVG